MTKNANSRGETQKQTGDLKKYYTLGLPLLGLMALVAALGVIATIIAKHFFQ